MIKIEEAIRESLLRSGGLREALEAKP